MNPLLYKNFNRLMTPSYWKQYLNGDEQLAISVGHDDRHGWSVFVPDSFEILYDDSLRFKLNKNTFKTANAFFKMDELWDLMVNPRTVYNLQDYKIDCKLIVQNKDMKFNIYGAYMIYPDKCDKFNCVFRPDHMAYII